jgi:hypothetical protein
MKSQNNQATRITVSTFGVLAGLIGILHGCFEMLQGNVATTGILIDAIGPANPWWHGGPAPALTLIPIFFGTGIFAVISSLMVILWVTVFIERKNSGLILFLLSLVQLFVGGGVAQIMLAILISALAFQIHAPLSWWRSRLSINIRCFLAKQWLWSFIASSLLYFLHYTIPFVTGIFGSFFGVSDPSFGLVIGYSAIGPFVLTVIAGFAYDSLRQIDQTRED